MDIICISKITSKILWNSTKHADATDVTKHFIFNIRRLWMNINQFLGEKKHWTAKNILFYGHYQVSI